MSEHTCTRLVVDTSWPFTVRFYCRRQSPWRYNYLWDRDRRGL